MLITLMFSVAAVESRTFYSLLCLANEQVCRSWEGAQPDREPSWPMEIFHTINVVLCLWMELAGGWETVGSSWFLCVFESSLGWEFKLFFSGCQSVIRWWQNLYCIWLVLHIQYYHHHYYYHYY